VKYVFVNEQFRLRAFAQGPSPRGCEYAGARGISGNEANDQGKENNKSDKRKKVIL